MSKQARDGTNAVIPRVFVPGITQAVAYTSTAGVTSDPITNGVSVVRLIATSACFILVGEDPTADNSGMYLAANVETFIRVRNDGTDKISAVEAAADGSLYVTEMS